MTFRDIKVINNYAIRAIEKDSKRFNLNDWRFVSKDIKAKSDKIKPYIAKRIIMSNLEIANNRIMEILSRNGIDHDKPLKIYDEAYQIAKNKENSGDLIKIADRYTELLDMKPQKVQISETRKEIDYSNMLPNEVKRTISTTKNIDNGKNLRVNTDIDLDNSVNTQQPDSDSTL